MRKTTLAAVGVCAGAMFLLFLAPAFRQAFRVSLTQWDAFFNPLRMGRELDFKALARRAEQQHDPDGLAFVAIHDFGQSGSARLADEAVKKRMAAVGVVVKGSTPDEFGQFLASEYKRWNAVREAANIPQQ